jgi:Acetyltransferase (GNAT) domain
MALEVVKLAEHDKWLDVLGMCSPYDFYHCPYYHEISVTNERYETDLLVYQEGAYTIAIPLVIRPVNEIDGLDSYDFRDATSVYGYAGPLASHESIPEKVIKNFHCSLEAYFEDNGILCAFSRLHPLLSQQHLLEDFGSVLPAGQTISIDLSLPPDEQYSCYRRNHKDGIRKLRQLNTRCIKDQAAEHLDGFIEIYHGNMVRVNAQEQYFFDKAYFRNILNARDFEMHLFVCLLDDKLICGGLFSLCNGLVQAWLAATADEYLKIAPMKLLIDEVRIWSNEVGANYFHLGGGIGAGEDSLFRFKAGFSNTMHKFCVWQMICRGKGYQEISRKKMSWEKEQNREPIKGHYFPVYRRPTI